VLFPGEILNGLPLLFGLKLGGSCDQPNDSKGDCRKRSVIGANAAIFSLMDGLLWRELPVRDPERLVTFVNSSRSYFGYTRFAENAGNVMESVVAVSDNMARRIDTGGGPAPGQIQLVSGSFFKQWGWPPG
jgi:hypothetical protein